MCRTLAIIALVLLAAILVLSQSTRAGVACSYEGEGAPTWTVGSETIWCHDTVPVAKSIQYVGEPETVATQAQTYIKPKDRPRFDPTGQASVTGFAPTYNWRHYWTTFTTCAKYGGKWAGKGEPGVYVANKIATGTCSH